MYNIDVILIPSSTTETSEPSIKGIRLWLEQRDALIEDEERDVLRKTILELVKKGHVHYTDIEKKTVATCLRFATSNTVRKQFYHYPLANGYVEQIGRGVCRITEKREKFLEILN